MWVPSCGCFTQTFVHPKDGASSPLLAPSILEGLSLVNEGYARKIPGGFISLSITYDEAPRLSWPPISEEWHTTIPRADLVRNKEFLTYYVRI